MLFNISLLVIIVGLIINAVSASPAIGTNAERMARGLPPKPPARMRRGTFFKVSPQGHASPSPSPSPSLFPSPSPTPSQPHRLPPKCYKGMVQVRYNSGHPAAFLQNGSISSLNDSGEPLEVNVCKAGSHTKFYNIVATNANFSSPHYVGASSGNASESLATDKESSLKLVNVGQTFPSAPPTLVDGSYVESAIWLLNSRTKELSAKWTNPDQSNSTTTILFDNSTNELSFVSGNSQWWNVSGSPSEAVRLYLT